VRQVARASKEAVAAAVLDAVEELRAAGETRGGVGARTLGDSK
jgi:hypothetical protein